MALSITITGGGRDIAISEDGTGTTSSATNRYTPADFIAHPNWPTGITTDTTAQTMVFNRPGGLDNYVLCFNSTNTVFVDLTGWEFTRNVTGPVSGGGGHYDIHNNVDLQAGIVYNGVSGTLADGFVTHAPIFNFADFTQNNRLEEQNPFIQSRTARITGELINRVFTEAGETRPRIAAIHPDSNFWFTWDGGPPRGFTTSGGFVALNNNATSETGFFGIRMNDSYLRPQSAFAGVDALTFTGADQRLFFQAVSSGDSVVSTIDGYTPRPPPGTTAPPRWFQPGNITGLQVIFNNPSMDLTNPTYGNAGGSARGSSYVVNTRHIVTTATPVGTPVDDVRVLMYEDLINDARRLGQFGFTEQGSNAVNSPLTVGTTDGATYALQRADALTVNAPLQFTSTSTGIIDAGNRAVYAYKFQNKNDRTQVYLPPTFLNGQQVAGRGSNTQDGQARSAVDTRTRYFSSFLYGFQPIHRQEVVVPEQLTGEPINVQLLQEEDPHVTYASAGDIPLQALNLNDAYSALHSIIVNFGRGLNNPVDIDQSSRWTVDGTTWDFGAIHVRLIESGSIGFTGIGTADATVIIPIGATLSAGTTLTGIRTTGAITIERECEISCSLEAASIDILDSVSDVVNLVGDKTADTITLGNGARHTISGTTTADNISGVATSPNFLEVEDRPAMVNVSGTINSRAGGISDTSITFTGGTAVRYGVIGNITTTTGITFHRTGIANVEVLGPLATSASDLDPTLFSFDTGVIAEPRPALANSILNIRVDTLDAGVAWRIEATPNNGTKTLIQQGVGAAASAVSISSATHDILNTPVVIYYKTRSSRLIVRRVLGPTRVIRVDATEDVVLDGLQEILGVPPSLNANTAYTIQTSSVVLNNNRISFVLSGVTYGSNEGLDVAGVTATYADYTATTPYLAAVSALNDARSIVDLSVEGTSNLDVMLATENGMDFVGDYCYLTDIIGVSNPGQQVIPGARFLTPDFDTTGLNVNTLYIPPNVFEIGGVPQVVGTPRFADRIELVISGTSEDINANTDSAIGVTRDADGNVEGPNAIGAVIAYNYGS